MEIFIKWVNIIVRVEDNEQDQHIIREIVPGYSAHEEIGQIQILIKRFIDQYF